MVYISNDFLATRSEINQRNVIIFIYFAFSLTGLTATLLLLPLTKNNVDKSAGIF